MDYTRISFAGREFLLHDVDGTDHVSQAMEQGAYEAPLPIMFMATAMRHPGLVLDVGANNGLYSVLACIVHPVNRVMAFEPYPVVQRILGLNIEANGLAERVEIQPVALSAESGSMTLYLPDPGHGLLETSCSLEAAFKPWHDTIEIESRRLDDVALPAPVKVMKVDIEGHEHAFLDGAEATIGRDRPFIFIEVLDIGPAVAAKLTSFLERSDYLDFRLRPDMAILAADVRYDPAGWNHAFVPRDRLAVFLEACRASNLPVLAPWRDAEPAPPPTPSIGLRGELTRNLTDLSHTVGKIAARLTARSR